MSQPQIHHLIIGSVRFTANSGHEAGFINEVSQPQALYQVAHEIGKKACHAQKLDRTSLANTKELFYSDLYQTLLKPCYFYSYL